MRMLPVLFLAVAASLSAQVRFDSDQVAVTVDGQPFTTFFYGNDAGKPFLAPLRSASGKVVTRAFPMEMIEGESRDHLHHRGLWFTYDDVNGVKFWENDPSYTKKPMGRVVVRETSSKGGDRSGTLTATMEWLDQDGQILLVEDRDMIFYSDPKLRIVDFHVTLTAARDITLGDTKEGLFAIRLAENFTERRGGKIVNAEGLTGMKSVWGKRSSWVDYSGEVDGEKLGIAIFDHPTNPYYPAYWHARDYGLFSLNCFGQSAFDPDAEERITKIAKGDKLNFRWRVVIHPGDAESGQVAELHKAFAANR